MSNAYSSARNADTRFAMLSNAHPLASTIRAIRGLVSVATISVQGRGAAGGLPGRALRNRVAQCTTRPGARRYSTPRIGSPRTVAYDERRAVRVTHRA